MTWILSIATKIAWWALPRLLAGIMNYVQAVLHYVELGGLTYDPKERRSVVLSNLQTAYSWVPEFIHRGTIELCVIAMQLGIESAQLERMESLVTDEALHDLTDSQKRWTVLAQFQNLFPSVPEKAARLLLELAVAKLKGSQSS